MRNGWLTFHSAFTFLSFSTLVLGSRLPGQDSATVLKAARDAQAAFERTRRAHLPFGPSRGGRCDEIIGRFCFWYGAETDSLPPEPPRIREARAALLRRLDSAAALLPGDPWIAGQRVRYLVEDSRVDSAAGAAQTCRATPWWCAALMGLALHAAGAFEAAGAVFDTALAAMPAEERCRWTDVSLLLEGELRGRYRRLPCAARHDVERRLWRLAQPLFLLPGNDRRTEHLARVAMTRLQEDARNAYGLRWGSDLAEILVRYGWEVAWTRDLPPPGSWSEPSIAGHQRTPSFHFLPATLDGEWALDAARPREGYAPPYAAAFPSLPHQTALFRRGDTGLVVAAYDLREDTSFARGPIDIALGLAPSGDTILFVSRPAHDAPATGVLTARVPWGPVIVSVEALSRSTRRAARARYAVRPVDGDGLLAISDLLLFDPADSLPGTIEEALPRARGRTHIGPDRTVGLFWEVYGLAPTTPVTYALTVRGLGSSVLRRAAEAIGLARRRTPVRLRWEELAIPRDAVSPRALVVDLSAADRGRYAIELTVSVAGLGSVTVTREIRLVSGADN